MGKVTSMRYDSLKKMYTREDLQLLIEMVGAIPKDDRDDVKKVQRGAWWSTMEPETSLPIIHRSSYYKSDLQSIVDGKKDIRHFINRCLGKSVGRWMRVFLREPIEQAPLYLNDVSLLKQAVARWRLSIAK